MKKIPWYGWYFEVLKKYAVFTGRASRSEFWYFGLMAFLIAIPIFILDGILNIYYFEFLYSLFLLVPGVAVTIRRLHDVGKSGFWYFINFIPFIGPIVLFVFEVLDSQSGPNKFGENPKQIIA